MSTSPPKVFGTSTPTEMNSPVRYYTGIGSRVNRPVFRGGRLV